MMEAEDVRTKRGARARPIERAPASRAARETADAAPEQSETAPTNESTHPAPGDDDGGRVGRLSEGVRSVRTGGRVRIGERLLLLLAGICAPLGLVLIALGWYGAANTPNLFEQIPYAISGGLFGLGLVFVGSFFYFAHWMTELVKEHRAQSAAVVEAITKLEDAVTRTSGVPGNGNQPGAPAPTAVPGGAVLVATGRGNMAHRADCVVVAGKTDLRPVTPDEGLAACKLCDPYAVSTS